MKRFYKMISMLLVISMMASFAVTANAAAAGRMEQRSAAVNGSEVDYWLYIPDRDLL